MILVKAGDVEQNPGPFDGAANIQEQELVNLAYDVPSSKYTDLCIALGVSYNQSQTILDRHLLDFTRSLNAVFFKWKDRQRDGTDCRQGIATALRGVNLDAFGDKMSKGGYLPQKAAPTESTVEDETQPLTKEQVDQCAQDFKTFYRTRLCKIKTDPLDFKSILEFERIYTNLVLLKNEMGTTTGKTPLDYAELLTTKVNGVFPKRLMVEGDGGAGKTTFCSKMAWDWAERTKEFEEFDWVLVIPFRNTKEGQTVGEIAKTYLSDSNTVQPRQIDKYILSAPTKVFIIFDGLDEYEGDILKESSDIAKILRSEKFVECRVMVTTRPWRAFPFKSHEIMMQTFAFLAIAGFDKENISIYITKYFQDDPAGYELIKYIESNDQIQENMAPFPLYIAMLCILWRTSDADKRNIIRKLKTFSQLFTAIIISLTDHYLTKQHQNPNDKILTKKEMKNYLSQIGKISYSGVLEKRLMYTENDFSGYNEAMEACCRIGVLSRDILIVPRQERRLISGRSCGPTVSRDLADVICSSTALTALELSGTALHDDCYGTLESKVKTSKVWRIITESMNEAD
ncbi:NACHT, LRR and PYD domains-containing protein 3-like [Strongylocentrotus purpuratus]|uniref:NACHT domain-containing protein n=1 Tax=Strongylocentrotus purpuratus TaxID=7668 RepID=A0A7M7PGY8_STRPU|nr:NACHT, LRR and PYD domains-containing protein 3-like [Strongylocentrotus purpuratus]